MQEQQPFDFSSLNADERLDLAKALQASVLGTENDTGLTPEQHAELNRRIAAIDAGEMSFATWNDVKERLLAQLRK